MTDPTERACVEFSEAVQQTRDNDKARAAAISAVKRRFPVLSLAAPTSIDEAIKMFMVIYRTHGGVL